jgi:hypothetical protein
VTTSMALGPLVGSAAAPFFDVPCLLIPILLCTVSMISIHSFAPNHSDAFAYRYKYSLDTASSKTNTGSVREPPRAAHPCCQYQVLGNIVSVHMT